MIQQYVKAREAAFRIEYEALCRKYGMIIDSCGCCNSPFTTDLKGREDDLTAHLEHLFGQPELPPPPVPVEYQCEYCGLTETTDKGPPVCGCVRDAYNREGGTGLVPTMTPVNQEVAADG